MKDNVPEGNYHHRWLVSLLFSLIIYALLITAASAETYVNRVWHPYPPGYDPPGYYTYDPVTISSNTTWTVAGSPYILQNTVTVAEGSTLTIAPGVEVRVGDNLAISVYGTVAANQVTFTRSGGGFWGGLYFAPTAGGSSLINCNFSYSGAFNSGFGQHVMPHGYWVMATLYLDSCNPTITGCGITNSETHGISLWSSRATITGNSFQNMGDGRYPLTFDTTDTFPVMSGNSTSGAGENGVALPGGAMSVSGTWTRPGVGFPYLLNGSPDVAVGSALTIDPGNTFKSVGEIGFYVNGTLNAPGSAALPILFTSRSVTPAAGNWRGIYLAPTATITAMNYVTIDYAGGFFGGFGLHVQAHGDWAIAALYLDGISPTLSHLSILHSGTTGLELYGASPVIGNGLLENCSWHGVKGSNSSRPVITSTSINSNGGADPGYYAVSLDASSAPNPIGVTFAGNNYQGVQIRGGSIGSSVLWKNWSNNAPYAVTGFVTVDAGLTLTIEPATTVKLSGVALHVYGTLTANSTTGRITFTSLADDSIGGDTNGNGAATLPAAGNWRGIYLSPTSGSSTLVNCTINYAGGSYGGFGLNVMPHGSWAVAAMYLDSCNPTITGCRITNSETQGIDLWSSKATITNNTFSNMGSGGYPLKFETTDTFPVMSGNSTSGTGENGIALPGGVMSVSGTWTRPGVNFPYLLDGSPDVAVGTTLTIDPGNSLKIVGDIGFYVNGTLNAPGSGALPIIFTSRSATPAPGNWRGVYLAPTATITAMSYVTIAYAGGSFGGFGLHVMPRGVWLIASLYVDGISPTLSHLSILQSETNGLELYGASPIIGNGLFTGCGWNALRGTNSSRPVITDTAFNGNSINDGGYFTISLDASSVPNPTGVTFSGNKKQGIEVRGGSLVSSALWKRWSANAPYAVTGDTTIDAGLTLTIEPASTVKFWGSAFFVNGILSANSSSGRITFTSLADDYDGDTNGDGAASLPAAGNWRGIYLSPDSGGSSLVNCNLSYSGASNGGYGQRIMPHGYWVMATIYVDGCNPTITGCRLADSETHGIVLWSSRATITGNSFQNMGVGWYPLKFETTDTFPVMSGNSTGGTGENGVAFPGGEITVSGTWTRPGAEFPYLLNGSPTVAAGAALTIAPGNSIKIAGDIGFYVNGTLNAPGTSSLPIVFTSRSATPAAGNWRGVYLAPTATITAMSYVTIAYAGGSFGGYGLRVMPHGGWVFAGLYVDGISPTLSHLLILNSETNGLNLYTASPGITAARFQSCGWNELLAEAGSQPVIRQSSFIGGSSNWGVNNSTPATVIDARNNYWGGATGPYHVTSNPSGSGVRVSDGVNYANWRVEDGFLLTVAMAGSGAGMVNSNSVIHCPGVCSAIYPDGDQVLLMPTEGESLFKGWSGGGCSGTGNCQVTLSGDTTVTATFNLAPQVRIDGPTPRYFETIQAACTAVTANNTVIQAREYEFVESVIYGKPYSVTLKGGYDKSFSTRPGKSGIKGKLTLGAGQLTLDGITVR